VIGLIEKHFKNNNIKRGCQLLKISRSSYYEKLTREISDTEKNNIFLKQEILRIYFNSKKIYGAPKIHQVLLNNKIKVSLKHVQRLMKELKIRSITVKKWNPGRSSKKQIVSRKNILNQDFTTSNINQKWVTDITYIYTINNGWCYLSSIEDLHTKKIISWDFSQTMDLNLVLKTLNRAIDLYKDLEGLIIHSDLGSQYTSNEYEDRLKSLNISHSFSKKGCPYDNAGIESFHSIIKKEEVYQTKYYSFPQAKIALFKYIEGFYNRRRIHSSINYLTPEKAEKLALAYAGN
jgi:transposase InsO family protein